MPASLHQLRDQFPTLDARVHLASCSYAPSSHALSAALQAVQDELAGDAPWTAFERWSESLRGAVAALLGASPRQISLQPNATIAAFQVASSIDWSQRPRILGSTADFPSITQVWRAQQARGARLELIRHDADTLHLLQHYRRAVDASVGLVSLPATDYVSGLKLPVTELAALARKQGSQSFCDAYQLIGTEPVDASALQVDYLAGGAMKYLLAQPGVAFLYARQPEAVQRLSELSGWQSRDAAGRFDPLTADTVTDARRFETGTPATAAVAAASAGIALLQQVGLAQVAARIDTLKQHAVARFAADGLRLRFLAEPHRTGAHVAIDLNDEQRAAALGRHLSLQGVQTSPRCAALRIAMHAFNTPEDIDRLSQSLVAASARDLV
jgi:selenocysteine lyase/cysteine desulfurase